MRIFVDGKVFENELQRGIARIFFNTLPQMCESHSDFRVTLIFRKEPQIDIPEHSQIKTLNLYNFYKFRPWRFWKSRYKKVQDYATRLMRFHPQDIWLSSFFTLPPNHWPGKQIVFVYDMVNELYSEVLVNSQNMIEPKKNAINCADRILCISQTTANDLAKIYPHVQSKINVTRLSHDPLFIRVQNGEIETRVAEKFLLYVGNRGNYKDFVTLMEAYSQWEKNKMVNLLLVGPELTADEENRIAELELSNKIRVFGYVDDQTLRDLYNQAMAFVYPSLYEGFGIPLLEAMACGCPVVASRIPSTLEVAQEAPIYFEPANPASLIEAFELVMNNENVALKISKGYEIASLYSWKQTADSIYQVLKGLND